MSGFVESIRSRSWQPHGAPAIARIIEKFDSEPGVELSLIMTRSFSDDRPSFKRSAMKFWVKGLKVPIRVLTFVVPDFVPRRLAYCLIEIGHALFIIFEVIRNRPDLIYIDRSNWFAAGLVARITNIPVFLRLLGVPPDMWRLEEKKSILHLLMRWAYRAPFSHVLCTLDGSLGDVWMERYLSKNVGRSIMLNGVGEEEIPQPIIHKKLETKNKKLRVVFVGRVEKLKGADFFIESLLSMNPDVQSRISPIIVGDGRILSELINEVECAGRGGWVRFWGSVPAGDVANILASADVYISLNRQGHVSNSNLEAISYGIPLIIQCLESADNSLGGIENILTPEAFITIPSYASPGDLSEEITKLLESPEILRKMRSEINKSRDSKLVSWRKRIEDEYELIRSIFLK